MGELNQDNAVISVKNNLTLTQLFNLLQHMMSMYMQLEALIMKHITPRYTTIETESPISKKTRMTSDKYCWKHVTCAHKIREC